MLTLAMLFCAAFSVRQARAAEAQAPIPTVEIWQGFKLEETQVFRQLMADFEKQYAASMGQPIHVKVNYVAYDDMFTKLRSAALAGLTPDIACMDAIKVTDLALGQALTQIDTLPIFKQRYQSIAAARPQFVEASFDAGVVNRLGQVHLYGLPVQTTTVALFWNRAMFRNKAAQLAAAGLDPNRAPRDWDELLAYAKVLTDKPRGVFGYGMQGSLWFNFPLFNMYGMDWVAYDAQGRATGNLNTPFGIAALQRIRTCSESGYEGGAWKRSALNPEQGFINQRYAMVLTGPWMVENFSNAKLDFDVALIPSPTPAEIKRLNLPPIRPDLVTRLGNLAWSSSNVGGQTGVILRTSAHPDLAFEVLDYFTSEAVQRRWASTLGQIPVRKASWQNLDTSKYPFMPKFMDQLQLSKRIPQIPLYGRLESDIFNPEINLLLQQPGYPISAMLTNMQRGLEQKIFAEINAMPTAP
jgi:ABC-type glycerol-3-phosphate transport system substrate-binding protein